MAEFIAMMIIRSAEVVDGVPTNLEAGQNKYRAYFVTIPIKLYTRYQATVDSILIAEGCGDCIVSE